MNLASELVLGRNQLLRTMEGHTKAIPGIEYTTKYRSYNHRIAEDNAN